MDRLMKLRSRERRFVYVGTAVILLALYYSLVIHPLAQKSREMQAKIASRQRQMEQLKQLAAQLELLRANNAVHSSSKQAQSSNFSLLTFLERNAEANGIRSKLVSLKPLDTRSERGATVITVEVRLQRLSMHELLLYLYSIESLNQPISLSSIRIHRRFDNQDQLDLTLRVSFFRSSG